MELQTLEVNSRTETGTGPSRRTRMAGAVPGIVYGLDKEPVSITLNRRAFEVAINRSGHGEHAVLQLHFADAPAHDCPVMIKAVQHHPVKETIVHADFMRIDLQKKIHVLVAVELVGRCKGITDGGVPDQQLHEIEIECMALNVPEKIELDYTNLEVGGSLHVSDLKVADGITVLTEAERAIIAIHPPRVAKDAVAEEGAAS